jgi:YVTN family beta-propeller protein
MEVLPISDRESAAARLPRHVQAAIGVGEAPSAVLVAGGSVWVANGGDGTVSRIDPATNRLIATIGVGPHPARLTADSGAVWVATAEGLQRIDPATNRVIQPLPLTVGLGDVLAADGRLWVSLNDGTVRRLDPADGRVLASVSLAPRGVSLLASGRGKLWAANGATVVAINPQRASVTERIIFKDAPSGLQLTDFALAGGVVWESNSKGGVFRFRVDPPEKPVRGQLVSVEGPSAIAAGPTGVFLASRSTQTVTRLDRSTGLASATIRLSGLSQVAVGADAVWATTDSQSRGTLYRIDPQATD